MRYMTNQERADDLMRFLRAEAAKVMDAEDIADLTIVERPETHSFDVFAYRSDRERIHVGHFTYAQIVERPR